MRMPSVRRPRPQMVKPNSLSGFVQTPLTTVALVTPVDERVAGWAGQLVEGSSGNGAR